MFHVQNGHRVRLPFDWSDELPPSGLPQNNRLVVYELPMRWIDAGEDGLSRQVGLGTFDKALFERLEATIVPLGVNAIELICRCRTLRTR